MADPKITFGEFVALARSKGIKDDTELDWVDFHGMDELHFKIYDGVRAIIAGKINWDKPADWDEPADRPVETEKRKIKRKLI